MTNWQFDPETNSGILRFEGDITISHVAELKERLVEAFNGADKITLDVSEVSAVDIAGVQLLCACYRYCCAHRKEIRLAMGGSAVVPDFLDGVGFPRDSICNSGSV